MTQTDFNFDHAEDQCSRILNYLKAGNKITPLDALSMFGCFRLGSRIYDIKKAGYQIERDSYPTENGWLSIV
jgi:hypothetical protein